MALDFRVVASEPRPHRGERRRPDAAEGVRHLPGRPARQGEPGGGGGAGGAHGPGRRVRLRALRSGGGGPPAQPGGERGPRGGHHRLHGADPAHGDRARPPGAAGGAEHRRAGEARRAARQRAHHRLRPGRADGEPAAARPRLRDRHDRDRSRDDRCRGRLRLQGPLRRRDPARHPACRRGGGGRGDPRLRGRPGGDAAGSSSSARRSSRWCRCWPAPSTGRRR